MNELETVQEEAKEAVNKKAKERAQVFFIGEQSTENPEIFYVSDYRLICAIMGYIFTPDVNGPSCKMQAHLHNYFRLPLRLLQTYKFHSISRVDTITTVIITIVILTMIGFPIDLCGVFS
ncbi:hypothetical protein NYD91_000823 [Escherichia coli]|nr:hypothetical protein [Escherichia coli]